MSVAGGTDATEPRKEGVREGPEVAVGGGVFGEGLCRPGPAVIDLSNLCEPEVELSECVTHL